MKPRLLILLCLLQFFAQAQSSRQVDSLLSISQSLNSRQNYQKARETATIALQIAEKPPRYETGIANSYMRIGASYYGQEMYEEALDYYSKALHIRRDILHDTIATARTYAAMSSPTLELEGPEAALNLARRAETLLLSHPTHISDSIRAMLYTSMTNIYRDLDSIEQAIAVNRKGLDIFLVSKDTLTRIKNEYALAGLLMEQEKLDEARAHFDTALLMNLRFSRTDSLTLGQTYEALGVISMRRAPSDMHAAIRYFEEAKNILLRFPDARGAIANIFFNIAEAYENLDNPSKAVEAYHSALEFYDKDSDAPNFPDLLRSRIESNKADMKNRQLQIWLTLALASLFVISIIALIVLLIKEKDKAKASMQLLETEKDKVKANMQLLEKEKENNLLKDQMFQLRHDIVKNFLQTIDGLNGETSNFFDKIKYLTNKVLAQIGYASLTKAEPNTLKAFAVDMHLQAEILSSMSVINDTYLDDLPDFPLSLPLRQQLIAIVAEAFSNIRKHAFEPNAPSKTASIRFEYQYNQGLILTIEDQGKGFDATQADRSGLRNLEARAAAVDGILTLQSEPGKGTTLRLVIRDFPEPQSEEQY